MARAGSEEGRIAVLLHEAPKRPDAAAGLMALAADYLREGQAMPQPLADYLANALAKAAKAESAERPNVLATELWVKQSANAPIKGREFDVFLLVAKHDAKVQSLPKRISEVVQAKLPKDMTVALRPLEKELVFDVMETLGVSERTARDRIKVARAGMANAPIQSSE